MRDWCRRFWAPPPKDLERTSREELDDALERLRLQGLALSASIQAYRVAVIELEARRADEEQRQRIKDCRTR